MDSRSPFEGVSNRATWFAGVEMTDPEDDTLIDLTGAGVTATMTLRSRTRAETIIASTDDGRLTFPEAGYAVWNVPASAMQDVLAGTYECGLLATKDGATIQGFLVNVPIHEGL